MDTKQVLKGEDWLNHPLHPAFVAVPIGVWIFSLVMDGLASVTKSECAQEAADRAVTVGLFGAGLSAATGIAEFTRTRKDSQEENIALTHGALNAAGTALYGINAAIRSSRRAQGRPTGFLPKFLSLVGVLTLGYTGWLGGEMAYVHGVGQMPERAKQGEEQEPSSKLPRREREKAHV